MYTKGDPDRIAKAQAESIAFYGMDGKGATAPGAVTLRQVRKPCEFYPMGEYAVHFANTQAGGYHGGNYCATLGEAYARFAERIERYDPDGTLNASFAGILAVEPA